MKNKNSLNRKAHFLGTKIRNLRKRNRLTMEDLSSRCIKLDPESAPSVSYLSMIERGKRVPSEEVLEVIAEVFQKNLSWFLDDIPEEDAITPSKGSGGGISGMALEPNFLFSNEILQIAIPEMLSQTGTSGRQFAHLLIRAHQEHHQNHFPDLERAAEEVGLKRLPLSLEELIAITKQMGMQIKWFRKTPLSVLQSMGIDESHVVTSFFDPPSTIYINQIMKNQSQRLKYNLAVHIGHAVLHDKDGMKNVLVTGRNEITPLQDKNAKIQTSGMDAQDILLAWRDFECSFFAGALLCPKVPFRQLLDRNGYEINTAKLAGVSESVAMRRMTAASPYPHWHYFDAYAPGKLKAVYRGNGIPLPWGNMSLVEDPCQHWAVFRMINESFTGTSAQISILNVGDEARIYACESVKVEDLAGKSHVLCSGIDLNPAIAAQGKDALSIANDLKQACVANSGSSQIPKSIKKDLLSVARILNINWVERGIENDARLICSRGAVCPRSPSCYQHCHEL
ncbi:helix-turn-helix domain protein [Marinomonas posidonica IVIA-Po-181]|uniref:Helix-turn-helix domain protein n=1 Tax=Marinomonas posidonica (strain CECT 7376 / NCIMB 14433 / IVIA-Po-181) TaxID=491952 RepID=F6CYM9_MARPP|nr:helix-turn-helix domain protein [Marinomonas posidonica IVIA-Po-181]